MEQRARTPLNVWKENIDDELRTRLRGGQDDEAKFIIMGNESRSSREKSR